MEEFIDIEIIDFDKKQTLLEVALNPKSTLLDARKELEESDVTKFIFVNEKGVKMAEKTKTVQKSISSEKQMFIRYIKDEKNKIEEEATPQSVAISVLNIENSEELFDLTLEPNATLSDAKKMIEDHGPIKFDVVTAKGVTIIGNKKISEMNGKIYIKRNIEKEKQMKKSEREGQKEKNYQQIENLKKEIKAFQEERKKNMKEFKDDNTLEKIKQKLEKIDPVFKLKSTEDIIQGMDSLVQDLSQYLNSSEPVTLEQDSTTLKDLVEQFTDICQPYYDGKALTSFNSAIDLGASRFRIDKQYNKMNYISKVFTSTQEFEKHQRSWTQQRNQTEADLSVGGVFWKVETSGSLALGKQQQKLTNSKKKTFQTKTHCIGYYCGGGVHLEKNYLVLTEEVKKDFWVLFQRYIKKQISNDSLTKKLRKFFENYGYQIQIGNYYLGGSFELVNTVAFMSEQSSEQAKAISNLELSVSIQGGGIFSSFAAAGKVSNNYQSQSANDSASKHEKSTHSSSLDISSKPPAMTMKEWREKVMNQKKGWIILNKKVGRSKLTELLLMDKNIPQKYKTQKFEKECDKFVSLTDKIYLERSFHQKEEIRLDFGAIKQQANKVGWDSVASVQVNKFDKIVQIKEQQKNIKEIPKFVTFIVSLKRLHLSKNFIKKIDHLDGLVNLQTLDLSYNYIVVIQNLEELEVLSDLNLSSNRIEIVDNLLCLPSLKRLLIYQNPATGDYPNVRERDVTTRKLRQKGVKICLSANQGFEN